MLSEDNFPCTSLHGANPHISVSMPIQGLGPSFMVALPGNDGSLRTLGIFAIGKFLQIVMHFLRSPSSLKVRFHVALSDIFHFSQLHSVAIA
jgi:hypothetical protein